VKVAFDTSFLVFLFNRKAGGSVDRAAERVDGLIQDLSDKKAKIIIPTPALTELLMGSKHTVQIYIERLKKFAAFQIRPYDERAAIELAAQYKATQKSNKNLAKQPAWNKLKFDRQIVAVAKVQGAAAVYSDDDQVRRFARECGMEGYGLSDIKVPAKQNKLPGMGIEDDEEDQSDETIAKPALVQRSGDRHPKGQAGTEAAEEKTDGKESGKE
jgi:hypothetical protein